MSREPDGESPHPSLGDVRRADCTPQKRAREPRTSEKTPKKQTIGIDISTPQKQLPTSAVCAHVCWWQKTVYRMAQAAWTWHTGANERARAILIWCGPRVGDSCFDMYCLFSMPRWSWERRETCMSGRSCGHSALGKCRFYVSKGAFQSLEPDRLDAFPVSMAVLCCPSKLWNPHSVQPSKWTFLPCFAATTKIRREKKSRVSEPRTKPHDDEKNPYQKALQIFWDRDGAPAKRSSTQKLQGHSTDGNAAVLEEKDNALRHATMRMLSELEVSWEAFGMALQEVDLRIATLDRVAPAVSSVCDQASWQVCGIAWLQKAKDVDWVSWWDLAAHRVHNDFKVGVGRAKPAAVMYATTTLLNFTSGPSKSSGWWLSNLQQELLDLQAVLVDSDSLPLSMWHRICKERGWN